MIFKLIPKFKLRTEGDPVLYIDSLYILNNKLQCYINFSTDQPTEIDRPLFGGGDKDEKIKDDKLQLYKTPELRSLFL